MNDLQHVDLHDFADYLKSRELVDDRHLPYYVRWLQRFLAGPGGDPQDAQRVFLEGLERSGQFPEWPFAATTSAMKSCSVPCGRPCCGRA